MKLISRMLPLALILFLAIGAYGSAKPQKADAQVFLPLIITKTFAPASIIVGSPTTITITVTNPNNFTVNGVNFTDALPAGLVALPGATLSNPNAGCGGPIITNGYGNLTMTALASCVLILSPYTCNTPGVPVVNITSNVTVTGGPTTPGATATLQCNPVPPTPVPNTPTPTPTSTPVIPIVIPVIPQVFQQPVGGMFNGPRGNTPTPVRAAVAAVAVDPNAMPVLRPPSTGEGGLADKGTSPVIYGLALIGGLAVITFGATRLRARKR